MTGNCIEIGLADAIVDFINAGNFGDPAIVATRSWNPGQERRGTSIVCEVVPITGRGETASRTHVEKTVTIGVAIYQPVNDSDEVQPVDHVVNLSEWIRRAIMETQFFGYIAQSYDRPALIDFDHLTQGQGVTTVFTVDLTGAEPDDSYYNADNPGGGDNEMPANSGPGLGGAG